MSIVKALFLPISRFTEEHCFFEGSSASPLFASVKSNVQMKMSEYATLVE
jgi:hypothetical protein